MNKHYSEVENRQPHLLIRSPATFTTPTSFQTRPVFLCHTHGRCAIITNYQFFPFFNSLTHAKTSLEVLPSPRLWDSARLGSAF